MENEPTIAIVLALVTAVFLIIFLAWAIFSIRKEPMTTKSQAHKNKHYYRKRKQL